MQSIVTSRFIECHHRLMAANEIRSSRQFALSLNYLPQSLGEILKGRRDATIELLRKAINEYGINPSFLFSGEMPMFIDDKEKEEGLKILTIVTNGSEEEKIVHVPVSAQAGYGGHLHNPVFFEDLPSFTLPDFRFKSGTFRCFDIAGDSMEPTLYSGEKVVCSYLPQDSWINSIKNDYVYVITTRNDVLIKRVVNRIKENEVLELFSDNSYYKPISMNIAEVLELWFVKTKISPFMPSPSNARNALHKEIDSLKDTIAGQSNMIGRLNLTIEKMLKQNRVRI